jgi:hypothetical protein
VHGAQRRHEAMSHAPARVRVALVRRVLAPREPALAAVRGGLLARAREQRPHHAALARPHAQQRPPPRRGREPVEHRLDLVGRRVPRGHQRVVRPREAVSFRVAQLARPGLHVADGRAGPERLEAGAQPLAQLGAEGLIAVRPVP